MEQKQKLNPIINIIIIVTMFILGIQLGCQGMLKLLGV